MSAVAISNNRKMETRWNKAKNFYNRKELALDLNGLTYLREEFFLPKIEHQLAILETILN